MAPGVSKYLPVIDIQRCNGCGDCAAQCSHGGLVMQDGVAVLTSPLACGSDGQCVAACKQGAVMMHWLPYRGSQQFGRYMNVQWIVPNGPFVDYI